MAEIRHFENRHDVIFSAEGGPVWIQFRKLVQNDMSTAVIWSRSKPDLVEFQYGGRLGEFNPRATCYIAGCCHLVFNVMIPELRITLQGGATR